MKVKMLVFTCQFAACSLPLAAQDARESLTSRLTEVFKKNPLPGFTAMVVDRKGVVFKKSFGYADITRKNSFTENTVENIGSVSKTFIAVALMKAIELGYFNLETNINDILPFKIANPFFPEEVITIRHLATHTSSVVDNDSIYNRSYRFEKSANTTETVLSFLKERGYTGGLKDTTLSTFLEQYFSRQGRLYTNANFFRREPGRRSAYSNVGSALAAYLIEIKAGMSFSSFCKRYILTPLKMRDTKWFLSEVDRSHHATPYFDQKLSIPFYSLTTYPDGGLRTSAAELGKYLSEMIRSLNGKSSLLKNGSIDTMFEAQFSANKLPDNFSLNTRNKGIFWNLYIDGFIGHDGDDPGVSTNILFNKDYGIIFMTNIYLEDRSEYLNVLKRYVSTLKN